MSIVYNKYYSLPHLGVESSILYSIISITGS
nr:MAG TPA: hypothetical protein [Caudoviricetes sp.]